MDAPARGRGPRPLLLTAIFASGAAGLMHEIVWAKLLVSLIGSTAHAQTAVLAVFMCGLALGAAIFGRRSDGRPRPLRTYARLELLIGAYGLCLPFLLRGAGAGYEALARANLEHGGALFALRFALAVLCLLLPAVWMGGTLPILARFLVDRVESTRRAVAGLYALNNLGAVLGVGAAGFWTLSAFGILPSLAIASALNVLAAVLALRAEARARASADAKPLPAQATLAPTVAASEPVSAEHYGRAQYAAALVALFASGFAAMGYEVVFTRVIALSFGSSTYSFSVMLMSFVTGLGIGSSLVARRRIERPLWLFGASQLAVAVALVAMTPWISRLPYLIGLLRIELGTGPGAFALYEAGKAALILLFLLAPTICIGFGFPLVAQIQAKSPARIGAAVGASYAWNTVGNVLGVVLTGLFLLPTIGILGAFHVQLAMNVLGGALVLAVAREIPAIRRAAVASGGAIAIAVYAVAGGGWTDPINRAADHLRMRSGPEPWASELLRERHPASSFAAWKVHFVKRPEHFTRYVFREDANATVLAYGNDGGVTLAVNSKPDASSFADPTGSDITTQMLLAHLPMLFARGTQSVLVIGHGSGITAGSAVLHGVEHADVVEISKGVLEADVLFAKDNHQVLSDPRVRVWQEDGRTFLRTTPRRYDAIISEPSNPWIAGIGGLFTAECFEEARDCLAPGGVLCLWFHEYEQSDESVRLVLRTLASVFPHTTLFQVLLDGDVIALASSDPLEPDFARLEERFSRTELRRDLARMRAFNLATLLLFHAVPESAFGRLAGEGPLNTDGHQRLEYIAPKAFFDHRTSRLVWENHCLARAPKSATANSAGAGFLDRYRAWREAQGDPVSRQELEVALRRAAASLDPVEGAPLLEALAARAEAAPVRTGAPASVARGAEPDPDTLSYAEATDRGADRFARGEVDAAMEYWRRAVALDPKQPYARANLALALAQKGDAAEAAREIEEALRVCSDNAMVFVVAAQILGPVQGPERAQGLLARAAELDQGNANLFAQLGASYHGTGNLAEATRCFERAYALEPTVWQHAATLAQLLAIEPASRPRALAMIEAVVAAHPEIAELRQVRDAIRSRR